MPEAAPAEILVHLARIEEQTAHITEMMKAHHLAINQRLDDMKASTNARMEALERRMVAVEDKERGTAVKSAGMGALSGAVTAGIMAAMKQLGGG